jgi:hypothetical protein
MELDNMEARSFLFEIYTMTNGDIETQVSMYDVGKTLGLENIEAGKIAEDLFIQGFAELKTLSGGIGITLLGLKALDIKVSSKQDESLSLGDGIVLEDQGIKAVEKIIQDIKDCLAQTKTSYEPLEEMVMDIKTIEIQMLSPNPKTSIIREILRSLHKNLSDSGQDDLAGKIDTIINS